MNSEQKPVLRCAIYTRKSSEEGLEQSFNSLDAQREACAAFISSQKQEGWRQLPSRFDDGGYSGGTMDRPALRQLLSEVEQRKVDVIVVYKVDRLTRSLSDFAKIVEILDSGGVSFVSVTQQFNTTSSMGRLTLNILLSFAQFEREVTGERIRDKIAASKKKGMWMGGTVPLGYDVRERRLAVNPEEAEFVRELYRLYLQLGSVRELKSHFDAQGITSKVRISNTGRRSGGTEYHRGALYQILKNRLYIGEIPHRDQSYPGQHEAIVPKELWQEVQAKLLSDNQGRRNGLNANCPSLLAGLIRDSKGSPMTPSHTVRNGRRYRYYVCRPPSRNSTGNTQSLSRLPAGEIEKHVIARVQSFLESSQQMVDQLARCENELVESQKLTRSAARLVRGWPKLSPREVHALLRKVILKVSLSETGIEVTLSRRAMRGLLLQDHVNDSVEEESTHPDDDLIHLELATKLKRVRGELTLVLPPDSTPDRRHNMLPSLLKAVARAHVWREQVIKGKTEGQRALSRQMGVNERYAGRICECAFLAPDIVEAILNGHQPANLTFQLLTNKLPADWSEQRRRLGFVPAIN